MTDSTMLDEIKANLNMRLKDQPNSMAASPDEVRIAWLVGEVEGLQKQIKVLKEVVNIADRTRFDKIKEDLSMRLKDQPNSKAAGELRYQLVWLVGRIEELEGQIKALMRNTKRDLFFEPINEYDFGRGVQKGSHGKYRWWFCDEENVISPDFELTKMGIVEELTPANAMRRLWEQGPRAWNKIRNNYPNVAVEMNDWKRRTII